MSEKIILRVPEHDDGGLPEYVSHGNFGAALARQETVQVTDARFADWLASTYGLRPVTDAGHASSEIPGYAALVSAGISIEAAADMTKEQLIAVNGIGAKTADAILKFFAETPSDGDNNDEQTDETGGDE